MKKTYINPELEVVMITTQQMLAASVNASVDNTPLDNGDALGHDDEFDW